MNKIETSISEISTKDKVSLVSFTVVEETLEMISLGVSEDLAVGSRVCVGVKASNIILARSKVSGVSITNQIEVKVTALTKGSVLCSVKFTFEGVTWESIVTQKSADLMHLHVGDTVVALIKSSDLSIVEVL
jgi:molybdate transport system regulatory protein